MSGEYVKQTARNLLWTRISETVLRLQTIVSREVAAEDCAAVTVGSIQAGTIENVIPDEAVLKVNVRGFDEGVRNRVLAAIERIVKAEAMASGAPKKPVIARLDRYTAMRNDREATQRAMSALIKHFPDLVREGRPTTASEDFGCFGSEWHVPSVNMDADDSSPRSRRLQAPSV